MGAVWLCQAPAGDARTRDTTSHRPTQCEQVRPSKGNGLTLHILIYRTFHSVQGWDPLIVIIVTIVVTTPPPRRA